MYAIVDIAGQQFKVEKDQKLFVHRLEEEEGKKVTFEKVLLIDNEGKVNVGTPVIEGAKVTATILEHMKGDKVIIFKKKRRKGYQVANGHRQYLTQIQIEKIQAKASKKAEEKKTEEKAEEKAEEKPE
jgi:large subunit ribosomal protein L21